MAEIQNLKWQSEERWSIWQALEMTIPCSMMCSDWERLKISWVRTGSLMHVGWGEQEQSQSLESEARGEICSSTDGSGRWYLYLHFPKRVCSLVCFLNIWNQKIKFPLSSQVLWPSSRCLASHLRDISLPQLSDTILFKGITKGTSMIVLSSKTVFYIQKSNSHSYRQYCVLLLLLLLLSRFSRVQFCATP